MPSIVEKIYVYNPLMEYVLYFVFLLEVTVEL